MSAILADAPVPSRPASRLAHDGRRLSREPVFVITAVQVLLFLLMLWKLPSYETYGSAQGNSLRILFLGFMGLTAYYMVQGSAVDALSMFMAVNLFEPAIQIEGWLPNKFMLAYIGACTLILASKHRPVRMGPEAILCFLVSALMLLNVLMSSGEEQLLINWAFYLMVGGVFCAFCKGLSLTPRHIRGLARVGGGSVALMVILSLAASYANNRLDFSVNVFVQSSFRLGYINLESYNTFSVLAALGLLLWIISALRRMVLAGRSRTHSMRRGRDNVENPHCPPGSWRCRPAFHPARHRWPTLVARRGACRLAGCRPDGFLRCGVRSGSPLDTGQGHGLRQRSPHSLGARYRTTSNATHGDRLGRVCG